MASCSSFGWSWGLHVTCHSGTVRRLGASKPLLYPKMRSMSLWASLIKTSEEFCACLGRLSDWLSISYWWRRGSQLYYSLCSWNQLSCHQEGLIYVSSSRRRWWTHDHFYSQSFEQIDSACASLPLCLKLCCIGCLGSWLTTLGITSRREDCSEKTSWAANALCLTCSFECARARRCCYPDLTCLKAAHSRLWDDAPADCDHSSSTWSTNSK